jgi:WhiB family redox-sensing transcriptional regulator
MVSTGLLWMRDAACRDAGADRFFPRDGAGVIRAQRICRGCLVRSECGSFALTHRIGHGVWGGLSERARRELLHERDASHTP